MNIGLVSGSSTPTAITVTTSAIAPSAYAAPDFQWSRPSPSSAQPRPLNRNNATSPTAAAGTVATLAHGVVKCATRLVSTSTTMTTATSTWIRNRCSAESCDTTGWVSTATVASSIRQVYPRTAGDPLTSTLSRCSA